MAVAAASLSAALGSSALADSRAAGTQHGPATPGFPTTSAPLASG
ncbi:hypothetical protein caldi_33790 [Caldinitratiruptor microaerophilus]|uniref:Uncharacterized protein n=1 Tax=Caldinitratiruptor microaerophilus TaxID=671077 RepID=A0AA35CP77_9FIRM|nr:hypothetical protein caldi_33790 [Caldinitratiruptor microaerophilus]